jgi:hypothetical protein
MTQITAAESEGHFSAKLVNFVYATPRWKFVTILVIVSLLKSGIWVIPNMSFSWLIARNPFVNPLQQWPEAHYVYWSWLAPFLAWCVGATGRASFVLFHFAFSVAFTALFVTLLFKRFSESAARTALVLFMVLPVSATPYFWVSMDSVTLFFMVCALAIRRFWPLIFLIGFALGMEHFEQSFCALAILGVALILNRYCKWEVPYSITWCLVSLAGVVAGKLLLVELFRHWHVEVNSGRLFWFKEHFKVMLAAFLYHFEYVIYSVFGVGWLFVLKAAEQGKKSLPLFIGILGTLMLLPVTADETRVTAIVSFPLICAFCVLNESFLSSLSNRFCAWTLASWAIVPYAWVWMGNPKWSVLPYDAVAFLHRALGWFRVSIDQLWPFH